MPVSQGPSYDDQQLARYLLGLLPEEETERVDEASLIDDDIARQLCAVENDLVDAYVRRTLAGDIVQPFEAHYLASPRRRQKVLVAERFVHAADSAGAQRDSEGAPPLARAAAARKGPAVPRVSRFYEWLVPRATTRWRLAATAAGLLIVACGIPVGALVVRDMRLGRALQEAEITRATLERRAQALEQQLHDQRSAMTSAVEELNRARMSTVALVLFPQTRSVGTASASEMSGSGEIGPTVSVPPEADRVALELRLEVSDFSRYAAALTDTATNRIVWRSARIAATSAGDQPAVSIAVPASVLKSQSYALELSASPGSGDDEIVGSYRFRIVRR